MAWELLKVTISSYLAIADLYSIIGCLWWCINLIYNTMFTYMPSTQVQSNMVKTNTAESYCNNNIHGSLCYFDHVHCDFHFAETITFIEMKQQAVKLYIHAGS